VFEGFFHDKRKVGAFGTIAVIVLAFVFMPFERIVKPLLGLIDLLTDLGEIGQLQRGTVFVDECLQIEAVVTEIFVFDSEILLREVECLMHQVGVRVI
jgi:hypothetical protein